MQGQQQQNRGQNYRIKTLERDQEEQAGLKLVMERHAQLMG